MPAASRPRRFARRFAYLLLGLCCLLMLAAGAFYLRLRASLPQTQGIRSVAGLDAPVLITRDALGVPTIRGSSRLDVARSLGFVHAQERFFQMDLLRRTAAGELAELFGAGVLSRDRAVRLWRFRDLATRAFARLPANDRALLEAYASGVNSGLAALGAPPFEHAVLFLKPAPWRPEDCLLVAYAMTLNLDQDGAGSEISLGSLHKVFPAALADFLAPAGTEWDAPLDGGAPPPPLAIPGPEIFDLRHQPAPSAAGAKQAAAFAEQNFPGSNALAVAGRLAAANGAALVASDMHLGLTLPNTWFRALLAWPDATAPDGRERRVVGVTLPGTPVLIVGSNGQVAWALTNGEFDTSDVVVVEPDPQDPSLYLTPTGPQPFEHFTEKITVRGQQKTEELDVVATIWGPIVGKDAQGRPLARRWTALDLAACNFNIQKLETVPDLPAALDVAASIGLPFQNFLCADHTGRIGWTAFGSLPDRFGTNADGSIFRGLLPSIWDNGQHGWTPENAGLLPPADHPRLLDPAEGRLWSANQRPLSSDNPELVKIGVGNSYDRGPRARQIRDDLRALDHPAKPQDLLAIQLDDRAIFLARWETLLLDTLNSPAAELATHPARAALRDTAAKTWTGRASVDSASYRLVRAFRIEVSERVQEPFAVRCRSVDRTFKFPNAQWEQPLWQLLTARPLHLLDPRYDSWDALLLAALDTVLENPTVQNHPLDSPTWGQRNTARIHHPFSYRWSWLSRWLDAPPDQLPGDRDLPRAQGPDFGASERMVVAPGDEQEGIFEMPGGQSGHPFSPHYLDGHSAWVRGSPTPLLPGPTVETLTLQP